MLISTFGLSIPIPYRGAVSRILRRRMHVRAHAAPTQTPKRAACAGRVDTLVDTERLTLWGLPSSVGLGQRADASRSDVERSRYGNEYCAAGQPCRIV